MYKKETHDILINTIDLPLFLIDGTGTIIKANLAAMDRYGFKHEEISTITIWDKLYPTLETEWKNQIAKVIQNRSSSRFQFDHNNRVKELFIWPSFDKEKRIKAFALMERDITENIQALKNHDLFTRENKCTDQQMHHASTLINLGTLVAGMAHEISNPNAFITTNAPLLERIWTDMRETMDKHLEHSNITAGGLTGLEIKETIPKLLRGITDGALRIDTIVKSLRSFSRPDPHGAFVPVCINQVIKTCLIFLNNEIRKSTKHFYTDLDKSLAPIAGIPQRIEQVIINLVLNACQALTNKDQTIILSAKNIKKNVVLKVTDQGCGIDEVSMKRIFDPFFTTKSDIKGTGLGLSITEKIVKDHQGRIEFESEPGVGTSVIVEFPKIN